MAAENDPFATLRAPRAAIPWDRPAQAPRDATTERVWIGADPHGLGFEVAVASWSGANPPTQEAMRALHAARLRNRAIPLTVVARRAGGQAWLFGPLANAPVLGPLPVGHAARIVQAALDEPTAGAARARIIQARDALETADIPGFDSQGLFAIRELTWGVPRRPDWAAASARSRALMATSPRGAALVQGLGFESRTIPGNALLLSVHGEPPRAVAILLRDDESFDAESARFAKSPIYHGLEIARQNNVRWLVVARGPQLRLYPTAPDVGVGRRGATQTYFGLDLALLDDQHAGYLELAFGAAALAPGGSVDQLLDASRDYAVSLGERLRERIYDKVVDSLSTAIARALGRRGSPRRAAPRARLPAHPADPLPAPVPGVRRGHPAPAAPSQRAVHAGLAQGTRPRPRRPSRATERPAQHLALGRPRPGLAGHRHRRRGVGRPGLQRRPLRGRSGAPSRWRRDRATGPPQRRRRASARGPPRRRRGRR